jgi:hypothetical protein
MMKMNKEKYEELMLRFAKELHDVGVTDDMKSIISAQCERAPNVVQVNTDEITDRFSYQHCGYRIEAARTVTLSIKKCKK